MPPILASAVCVVGILGLFYLDRGHHARVSIALWIPTVWMMNPRPFSMWLGMTPAGNSVYLEGSPIDRAVILSLFALGLLVVIRRVNKAGPILRKNWPILLFFAYAAASIAWSDFPFVTFKHWVKGIGDVVMVLIVLTEPSVTDAIERIVTRGGFVLLPLSVLFIKYYPSLGRAWSQWGGDGMYTGVSTTKNSLGELCTILGLGLLWRFRSVYNDRDRPGRSRRLVALGTVLGIVVWLLHICNSLTSICALIMAGTVMLLTKRSTFRRTPALAHMVIAAMLGVSLFALFFQSSRALVVDLGRSPNLSDRTAIWATVLSVPVSRWVGAGYETFWLGPRLPRVWDQVGMDINEAHNGYIEMLVNLGWIGVGLLGVLIAMGYRHVFAALRCDPDYGGLRMAFLLNAVVTGFTEAAFRMMDSVWIFFLLAAIAVPVAVAIGSKRSGDLSDGRLELDREVVSEPEAELVLGPRAMRGLA